MYYDGECGLCARSVQFCLRHDKRGVLRFAPLQGSTYASVQHDDKPTEVSTMVLSVGDQLFIKSTAVLKTMRYMGGFFAVLGAIGLVVPRVLRDWVYSFVAKRRIAWFGVANVCHLPNPKQKMRFLD